jgi:hypothetical protein
VRKWWINSFLKPNTSSVLQFRGAWISMAYTWENFLIDINIELGTHYWLKLYYYRNLLLWTHSTKNTCIQIKKQSALVLCIKCQSRYITSCQKKIEIYNSYLSKYVGAIVCIAFVGGDEVANVRENLNAFANVWGNFNVFFLQGRMK